MAEQRGSGYEFFEHTADIGIRARGATLEELFVHAAQGLVALLVEDSPIVSRETRSMELSADSREALLAAWLKELLFWFAAERFISAAYRFEQLTDTSLKAWIGGEACDPARHAPGTEVKGITYHQLCVERLDGGWKAEIIVDV